MFTDLNDDRLSKEVIGCAMRVHIFLAQTITYLKLSNLRLGLSINFNVVHLRDGIKRVVKSACAKTS